MSQSLKKGAKRLCFHIRGILLEDFGTPWDEFGHLLKCLETELEIWGVTWRAMGVLVDIFGEQVGGNS